MGNLGYLHKARKYRKRWGMRVSKEVEHSAEQWIQTMHELFGLYPVLGVGAGGYGTGIKIGQLVKMGDLNASLLDAVEALAEIEPATNNYATVTYTNAKGFVFNLPDCDPVNVRLSDPTGEYISPLKIAKALQKNEIEADEHLYDRDAYVVIRVIKSYVNLHFHTEAEARGIIARHPDLFKASSLFATAAVTKEKVPILFDLSRVVADDRVLEAKKIY